MKNVRHRFETSKVVSRLASSYRRVVVGPRRPLESARIELRKIRKEITKLNKSMESRFLSCAAFLDTLTESSNSLVTDSERLVTLATGKEDGESMISETVRVLEQPLAFLDRWHVAMAAHLDSLREVRTIVARLCDTETALSTLFLPLSHAQMMFRVEASRLDDEGRSVFATLTDEIGSLQAQVGESFRAQFRILANALSTIDHVARIMETESSRVAEAVQIKKQQIEASILQITGEIEKNAGREIQFSATSKVVADQVICVVMALQAHDIVTQRLGNICSGLTKAEDVIVNLPTLAKEPHGVPKAAHQTSDLIRIQSAQLIGTIDKIRQSEQSVHAAVSEILNSVHELNEDCLQLKEFTEVIVAADGTVQVLLDMIEDVRTLTASSSAVAGNAQNMVQPITALADELTGTVRRLAGEMLLIALNAQLRAVQIGSGTGLEVLAAYTADVSSQTSTIADSLSERMNCLIGSLGTINTGLGDLVEQGAANLHLLETEGALQESHLHGLRDYAFNQLRVVCDCADNIGQVAEELGQEISGEKLIIDPLLAASAKLTAVDTSILAAAPERDASWQMNSDHHLAYTMAAERETHRAVMEGFSATPGEDAPAEQPQEDTFIEMF